MLYIRGSHSFSPGNFDLIHVFPRCCNDVFNSVMDAFSIAVCTVAMKQLVNFSSEMSL